MYYRLKSIGYTRWLSISYLRIMIPSCRWTSLPDYRKASSYRPTSFYLCFIW